MSRLFLTFTLYVAAPAYAYFEAVGFPEVSIKGTVALATQIAKSFIG